MSTGFLAPSLIFGSRMRNRSGNLKTAPIRKAFECGLWDHFQLVFEKNKRVVRLFKQQEGKAVNRRHHQHNFVDLQKKLNPLYHFLQEQLKLPQEEANALFRHWKKPRSLKRGDFLTRKGQVEQHLYYILEGTVIIFYDIGENVHLGNHPNLDPDQDL